MNGSSDKMPISTGTRLGVYEVVAPLGAGGMGEVYKARDSRLDRTVAIKIVSDKLNPGPELKARFEREARAIAQLQHPHICTLYDIGRHEDTEFLVMEYLEGESLADRLKRGPLPLDQILQMGSEIASALDRAHRAGIVHRDLKPGNIMLTKSGAKLLDFGLAKPRTAEIAGAAPLLSAAITMSSPIPGASPLTTAGTVLGTIQYMSPEQLEGKPADARSDIFAFGAVMYEAVSGKPAFEGKSQLSVATAILEKDPPPPSNLQPAAPAELDYVIKTCLAKDPEQRFQCAHDIGVALRWIAKKPASVAAAASRPKWATTVLWAAVPIVIVLAALLGYWLKQPVAAPVIRSDIALADDMRLGDAGNSTLSPDGSQLAFVAMIGSGKPALWIRTLNSLKPRRVDDTDDAQYPFWSPDSRYVGFFTPGRLRRVDTTSFTVSTICAAADGRGGTWNTDDVIVFAGGQIGPLSRVSASGGEPTAFTKADASDQTHRWPQFLPDGDHLIYVAASSGRNEAKLLGTSLTKQEKILIADTGGNAVYSDGYLLYLKSNNVLAQRFDSKSFRLSGAPRTIIENVATNSNRWVGEFSVARNRALVYRVTASAARVQLIWIDENGNKLSDLGQPGPYETTDLSPESKRVLLGIRDPQTQNRNYWMMDVARGVVTRFTFDSQFIDTNAQWSYDGKFVLFSSNHSGGHFAIYRKDAVGTEPEQLVYGRPDSDLYATTVSWDGKLGAFADSSRQSWVLPLTGNQAPYQLLNGKDHTAIANWSPDGRWVLFVSDQTGRNELYVTSFPQSHGRWQISSDGTGGGGIRGDGRKLIYLNNEHKFIMVDFDGSGAEPRIGRPEIAFGGKTLNNFVQISSTADWKHWLAVDQLQYNSPRLTLVSNWKASQ